MKNPIYKRGVRKKGRCYLSIAPEIGHWNAFVKVIYISSENMEMKIPSILRRYVLSNNNAGIRHRLYRT